jgi:hypothetical protein
MKRKEVELPGDVIVTTRREALIEAEIQRRKTSWTTEKLDEKRSQFGNREFEKQRPKLTKEVESRWETMRKTKAEFDGLMEQAGRVVMKWAPLEKLLRSQLEAEGCQKSLVENTVKARRSDFERLQRIVQNRLRPKPNPDLDFRQRVLNPATRKEAIEKYLINHTNKTHFQTEAFNLIFEELDKRK